MPGARTAVRRAASVTAQVDTAPCRGRAQTGLCPPGGCPARRGNPDRTPKTGTIHPENTLNLPPAPDPQGEVAQLWGPGTEGGSSPPRPRPLASSCPLPGLVPATRSSGESPHSSPRRVLLTELRAGARCAESRTPLHGHFPPTVVKEQLQERGGQLTGPLSSLPSPPASPLNKGHLPGQAASQSSTRKWS